MGVGGVDDEDVHVGVDKLARALIGLLTSANAGGHEQAPGSILGGVGELLSLDKVLDGDKADELVLIVDDGQFLHLVGGQQLQRLLLADALLGHDERHRRHNLGDLAGEIRLEAHVTVGADAHEGALLIDNRQARNPEPRAQRVDFIDGHVRGSRDRVGHHAGFGALDNLYLLGLILN